MASTTTSLFHPQPKIFQPVYNTVSTTPPRATARPPSASRRDCLIFTATTALTAVTLPSSAFAKDIPLFGLRKNIEKAEEQAEELVKESFETVEKGIENVEVGIEKVEQGIENVQVEIKKDIPLFGLRKKIEKAEEQAEEIVKGSLKTVEKGIETTEKRVVATEKQIESGSFNGLAQAGVVAGAEVLGVLIATSIVNGILGPEPKNT